jgi:hypothetical protein
MFWRSRDLPLSPISKTETLRYSRKKVDALSSLDKNIIDTQMQSLKDGLKEYMSGKNDDEKEREFISIKTSTSFTSDSNFISALSEKQVFVTFNESYCKEVNCCDYLITPEGITRIPFKPLPNILLRTIPSPKKLMNYYQRKAARSEPKSSTSHMSSSSKSPFRIQRQQRQAFNSPRLRPQSLFTTIFGGGIGAILPSPRKGSSKIENSNRSKPGISWASQPSISPTVVTSIRRKTLNFYQSNLAPYEQTPTKSPGDHQKTQETALNETLLPSERKEVDTGLQYLHSSKTPRSSPNRRHDTLDQNFDANTEYHCRTSSLKPLDSPSPNSSTSLYNASLAVDDAVPNLIDQGIWFGQE